MISKLCVIKIYAIALTFRMGSSNDFFQSSYCWHELFWTAALNCETYPQPIKRKLLNFIKWKRIVLLTWFRVNVKPALFNWFAAFCQSLALFFNSKVLPTLSSLQATTLSSILVAASFHVCRTSKVVSKVEKESLDVVASSQVCSSRMLLNFLKEFIV